MAGVCVPRLYLTRAGLLHSCGNLSCLEKVVGDEWDTQAENACFSLPYHSLTMAEMLIFTKIAL